jgi:hypothetical protein
MEDFPAPFGPMMAKISPFLTSKETPESARTPPKFNWMSLQESWIIPSLLLYRVVPFLAKTALNNCARMICRTHESLYVQPAANVNIQNACFFQFDFQGEYYPGQACQMEYSAGFIYITSKKHVY